jgi:hypothetical protein
MPPLLLAAAAFVHSILKSWLSLQIEILALRHQLGVYQCSRLRPRLRPADRIFWVWLSRVWLDWRDALVIVQPATVIAWQRKRFREYWTKLAGSGNPGRRTVPRDVRDLIRRMSLANPLCRSRSETFPAAWRLHWIS